MAPYRIAIQGAQTLLGKELHTALDERHFPVFSPKLLEAPHHAVTAEHTLAEFGGEAAVLEPCTAETLAEVELCFLAGTATEARDMAEIAPKSTLLVDLTGGLAGRESSVVAGLEAEAAASRPPLIVVAHPAAQALAHVLDRLQSAGVIQTAAATVFEPASQRGWAGIQELQQQSTRLLSLQGLPEDVFGCQVAFDLRPRLGAQADPGLGAVRRRIAAELQALGVKSLPAVSVLQAPVFHGSLLSLYVCFRSPVAQDAVLAALASSWLAPSTDYPDAISAAGADRIALGPIRSDPAGGYWLWAAVDNLRRTAFSAVDAALAARAGAP
ncbi:MAG: Asd/ArgC dimerization domain-containing protein [Terriglobales bacterium]